MVSSSQFSTARAVPGTSKLASVRSWSINAGTKMIGSRINPMMTTRYTTRLESRRGILRRDARLTAGLSRYEMMAALNTIGRMFRLM